MGYWKWLKEQLIWIADTFRDEEKRGRGISRWETIMTIGFLFMLFSGVTGSFLFFIPAISIPCLTIFIISFFVCTYGWYRNDEM